MVAACSPNSPTCLSRNTSHGGSRVASLNLGQVIIYNHSHLASRKNVLVSYAAVLHTITPTYRSRGQTCFRRVCRHIEKSEDDVRHCSGEDAAVFLQVALWWPLQHAQLQPKLVMSSGARSRQGHAHARLCIGICHIQRVAWAFLCLPRSADACRREIDKNVERLIDDLDVPRATSAPPHLQEGRWGGPQQVSRYLKHGCSLQPRAQETRSLPMIFVD